MAIVSPQEPAQGQQALQDALPFLLSRSSNSTGNADFASPTGGAPLDQLQYTQPHQVYTMGLDDLAAGSFLDAAQPGAWRYLLVDPTGTKAVAEAQLAADANGALSFAGLTYGPQVAGTVDGLVDLEQNSASIKTDDYELRFLQAPALQFFAIWLHGASDDIIRPIPPTPATIMDAASMSPSQVQPGLQAAAQAIQAQIAQLGGASAG